MDARDLWERALAGSQWLVGKQTPDGGWSGLDNPLVDGFYKSSWALTLTGHLPQAHRSLDYARRRYMTADGDFLPRGHQWHRKIHYLYANAYFVVGAVAAGRYEIAAPASDFILSQQDPQSGGFYSRRVATGESTCCDTMSAGAAGIACLASGQFGAARKLGGFLQHMVDLQPEPEQRFYTTLETDGKLLTAFPEEDAFARVIDTGAADQCWYAVGLPFAFLVQLEQGTGESRFGDLAQSLFGFQTRCVNPWEGGSSGKAGWACAMLYGITGEDQYREIALRVARFIVSLQDADGGWVGGSGDGALSNSAMDASAEFTLWCALIAANILARDTS